MELDNLPVSPRDVRLVSLHIRGVGVKRRVYKWNEVREDVEKKFPRPVSSNFVGVLDSNE